MRTQITIEIDYEIDGELSETDAVEAIETHILADIAGAVDVSENATIFLDSLKIV